MSYNGKIERTLNAIAMKELNLETLLTRNSDSLDFSDQAVWSIRKALYEAFNAGSEHALKAKAKAEYEAQNPKKAN